MRIDRFPSHEWLARYYDTRTLSPRRKPRRRDTMVKSAFLRSINIQLDIGHPERLEHFRPTSKSTRLVSSLLQNDGGNALFVVAPYGSGKSITAGYVGELVENRPGAADVLEGIEARMSSVEPALADTAGDRRSAGTKGSLCLCMAMCPLRRVPLRKEF